MQKLLLHKNVPVLAAEIENKKIVGNLKVIEWEHLPFGVRSKQTFLSWLSQRAMPDIRDHADIVKNLAGIQNMSDFAWISHGASITDTYWFAEKKEFLDGLSWEDVSFHKNGIHSNVGVIAFFGMRAEIDNLNSPDVTTNGHLPKIWKATDKGMFLIKGEESFRQQVFAELTASRIAKAMGIEHVPYYYTDVKGRRCSVCPCITDGTQDLVSFHQISGNKLHKREYPSYAAMHGMEKEYARMMVLDGIINNTDRTGFNMNVLVDPDTQEITGMAPLLDHGESFQTDIFTHTATEPARSPISGNRVTDDMLRFCEKADIKPISNEQLSGIIHDVGDELGMERRTVMNIAIAAENRNNLLLERDRVPSAFVEKGLGFNR